MHFFCVDGRGHSAVGVQLRDRRNGLDEAASLSLQIPLEPAAIDNFVEQLRQLDLLRDSVAYLEMAK
jgi:hypothetical protein